MTTINNEDNNSKIEINGQSYEADALNPEIKQLIGIYQKWQHDLEHEREAYQESVFKTEAAMRAIGAEISARLKVLSTTPPEA